MAKTSRTKDSQAASKSEWVDVVLVGIAAIAPISSVARLVHGIAWHHHHSAAPVALRTGFRGHAMLSPASPAVNQHRLAPSGIRVIGGGQVVMHRAHRGRGGRPHPR